MYWDKEKIKVVHCFGDSLTFGYGVPLGHGWVGILDRRLKDLDLYNHGRCGSGVQDIYDDMALFLNRPNPGEGMFFMGGTNDILGGRKLSRLEQEVTEIVTAAAAKAPLTLGIPPLATRQAITTGWEADWNFDANQKDLESYGNFLRALAGKLSLPLIDFSTSFPLDDAWYYDGVHPNEKGYTAMADTAEKVWRLEKSGNQEGDISLGHQVSSFYDVPDSPEWRDRWKR